MAISTMGEPILEVSDDALPSPCRLVNTPMGDGDWNPTGEWHDLEVEVDWMCVNGDPWQERFGVWVDMPVKMMIK